MIGRKRRWRSGARPTAAGSISPPRAVIKHVLGRRALTQGLSKSSSLLQKFTQGLAQTSFTPSEGCRG